MISAWLPSVIVVQSQGLIFGMLVSYTGLAVVLFDDWSTIPFFSISLCVACSLATSCLFFETYSSHSFIFHPWYVRKGRNTFRFKCNSFNVDTIVFRVMPNLRLASSTFSFKPS